MKMGLAFRWPRRTAALRRGQNAAVRMVSDPVSVLCSQPARLSVTDSLPCVRSSLKGLFSTLRFKRAQDAPPPPPPVLPAPGSGPGFCSWPVLLIPKAATFGVREGLPSVPAGRLGGTVPLGPWRGVRLAMRASCLPEGPGTPSSCSHSCFLSSPWPDPGNYSCFKE